jgi:folate-binding protein YgfZ
MDHAPSHAAARPLFNSPGQVALDGWTTIRVAGKDRAAFLQNMCTNDVRSLVDGSGCEAFFTDVKGKIIAHAFVLAAADELLLVAVPGVAERLIPHLERYIIREDVQLVDQSAEIGWTLIAGQESTAAIGRIAAVETSAFPAVWSHSQVEIAGKPIRLVRCDLPWPGGFLAACLSKSCEQFRGELAACGAPPCADDDWQALRIESGWPLEGVDFDGTNFPQEVGRDAQAISFRKGCYLGQETIARIDSLGHVNKRLATVRLDVQTTTLPSDPELRADGQPVGRVTSSAQSSTLNALLGLAMVKRGFNDPGQRLTASAASAEIISTPACPPASRPAS